MNSPQIVLKTENGDKVFEMHEGQVLFAGRTAECDICLPTPAVSRRHAILVMREGKCGLKDLGSGNGTYLNGKKLERPVKLRSGDVIQIAAHVMEFVLPAKPSRYKNAEETILLQRDQLLQRLQTGSADVKEEIREDAWPAPSAARSSRRETRSRIEEAEQVEETAAADTEETVELAATLPESGEPKNAGRRRIDANTVRKVRESIRLTPKAPPAPKVETPPEEDEIGDGSGNTGLWVVIPKEADKEKEPAGLELNKAAADAGLVGEFSPDEPEALDLMDVRETLEADDDDDGDVQLTLGGEENGPPAEEAGIMEGFKGPDGLIPLPSAEANPDAIPVNPKFRQAIESRLFFYSFMEDLRREREEMLAANADAPDAVKSEVDRQNREMAKTPTADQADDRIEKVNARREALKQKIAEAKKAGTAMPPRPSKLMRDIEDVGINQWTIISQSLREALPMVFDAGYEIVRKEPLGRILEEKEIDAKMLFGGGAYCLALEELLAEAKFNRAVVKEKMAELPPPDEKKSAGMLSRFGRKDEEGDDEEEESSGESYEALKDDERMLGLRAGWITQEMAYIEEMLIKEFWNVYLKAALAFIPDHRNMEVSVRAFLRYGVIGFSRWWLKKPVREFVMNDCSNEVRHTFEVGGAITNVVYAEEYLAAVMEERCTPAMDENLEINEKNSPNWKADKALRRLINTRAQIVRTQELADSLQGRIDALGQNAATLDDRIAALLPGSKNFKIAKQELSQDRQAIRIEVSKLTKLEEKLTDSIKGDMAETVSDTEKRFESGELPRPTPEFLIEREVGQVRRIGRLTANLKERLLPLAMREYQIDTDAANDRPSILGEFADIERRDPRIFVETLVPSKKKANRVDMRISPVVVLVPSAGVLAFSWNPRQKPEDGRLAIPTFFIRQRIRERQMTYLMSDFRWDTAKASAGMDLMNSETIVAEFMRVRWDWRKRSKEMREKGLVYTEQNDRTNWRRVYEAYLTTAFDGGKKLYNRNYDFYERIIGKYFDLPEGVEVLRK